MKLIKGVATLFFTALLAAVMAPSANADEWNRKTVLTFSAPVQVPGIHAKGWDVLPPGTYVFKIMDSQSNRHIVQIFNKEETMIYATVLAIPNERLTITDKTVITFRERRAGEPEALRAWFYPGRAYGEEFVYPKEKAAQIAKSSDTPVLFTPQEVPAEVTAPIQTAEKPAEEPAVAELTAAPVMVVKPSGEEVQMAQVVAPTLPATGSQLPLLGLLGLLGLSAALAVRFAEKRIQ